MTINKIKKRFKTYDYHAYKAFVSFMFDSNWHEVESSDLNLDIKTRDRLHQLAVCNILLWGAYHVRLSFVKDDGNQKELEEVFEDLDDAISYAIGFMRDFEDC